MDNAFSITPREYEEAIKQYEAVYTLDADRASYFQLLRYYRGQISVDSEVARAIQMIRGRRGNDIPFNR